MIAAIYARKSTEQTGVAETANASHARPSTRKPNAAKKGWTVADEHKLHERSLAVKRQSRLPTAESGGVL